MKIYNKGEAVLIVLVVVSLIGGSFLGFKFTQRRVKNIEKELTKQEQIVNLQENVIKDNKVIMEKQDKVISDTNKVVQEDTKIKQEAANQVARIVGVYTIQPPTTRPEEISDLASRTAAKLLPPPSNWEQILQEMRKELDTSKTSLKELQDKYNKLSNKNEELVNNYNKVVEDKDNTVKELNKTKEEASANSKLLTEKTGLLSKLTTSLNKVNILVDKFILQVTFVTVAFGLVLLILGMLGGSDKKMITIGVVSIVTGMVLNFIPTEYFTYSITAVILFAIFQVVMLFVDKSKTDKVASYYKTGFDNCIASIGHFREENPELYEAKLKAITTEWFKDAPPDMKSYIDKRLQELNVIPLNADPNPLKRS